MIVPRWCIITFIQIISTFGFGKTAFECKSSCAFVKLGIGTSRSEVTSLAVGVIVVSLAGNIIYCAFERGAAFEHLRPITYLCCHKLVADIDGFKRRASPEHPAHIFHVLSIELREVERMKTFAPTKHSMHILHLLGIKLRDVERGKAFATIEHRVHIFHVLSIEVRDVERFKT